MAALLCFVLVVQLVCWYGKVGHWALNKRVYSHLNRRIADLQIQLDRYYEDLDNAVDYGSIVLLTDRCRRTEILIERHRAKRAEIIVEFREAGRYEELKEG